MGTAVEFSPALFAHPAIPTPSWEPRCKLCRLARDLPEAYEFVTQESLGGTSTQQQIADELLARWGVTVKQKQISVHLTDHLKPDLRTAHETFVATQALITALGDVPAVELVQKVNQVALLRMLQELEAKDLETKDKASLGRTIAALNNVMLASAKTLPELEAIELENALTRVKLALAQGNYREAFAAYVESNFPHLVSALSAPATEPGEG